LLKTLPSSSEEGWRAERRGGADSASAKRRRVFPQPVKPRLSEGHNIAYHCNQAPARYAHHIRAS
jgi:hypothetical protein